ncbi:MAG TPA: hypothetical protein VF600_11200 [Abditibacteriaceae bacterium]|jgi:hypothetical protein
MNILESETVEAHFTAMLHEAGVDMKHPRVHQVWDVFKQFAQLPVECAAEHCVQSFLFESGCYGFADGAFTLHFSRNFHIGDQGAAWTEMLDCDFTFDPNRELQNVNVYMEKVAADYMNSSRTLAAFIEAVESETALWQVIARYEATEVFIGCHGV